MAYILLSSTYHSRQNQLSLITLQLGQQKLWKKLHLIPLTKATTDPKVKVLTLTLNFWKLRCTDTNVAFGKTASLTNNSKISQVEIFKKFTLNSLDPGYNWAENQGHSLKSKFLMTYIVLSSTYQLQQNQLSLITLQFGQ